MAINAQSLADKLKITLDSDQLTNCMRCGFCQTACPTFEETGLEAASPRGRIALMKAASEGKLAADEAFKQQMDLCLGCRACEPACPSDVKYGQLIEQAREAIASEQPYSRLEKMVRKLFMEQLFPNHGRMRFVGGLLKWYQKSGLQKLVRAVGIMKLFPDNMREMEAVLPEGASDGTIRRWQSRGLPGQWEVSPDGGRCLVIPAVGDPIARVGMFRGCIMDVLFTETNVNTIRLLRQAGYEVVVPEGQTCCGALHAHAGEMSSAGKLAVRNVRVFGAASVDYVVSNAGGCGASLKEYDHLLHDGEAAPAAKQFAGQVKDISELLVQGRELPLKKPRPEAGSVAVTYQDSCHLRNVMRVQSPPRQLISAIPGATLKELPDADRCCGSAGIYNLTQPDMSTRVLDRKMDNVRGTKAEVLLTANPGCLLQMKWGVHRAGLEDSMSAMHLVDFLAEAVDMDTKK